MKEKENDAGQGKLRFISSNLVDMGELSLTEAEGAIRRMANLTSDMFDGLTDVLGRPHEDLSQRVVELKQMEATSDEMLHDITAYLIQCSTHEIGSGNAFKITSMLRVVSEFEEAMDRIYRLVKTVQRRYKKGRVFSPTQNKDLEGISMQVRALLDAAKNSLVEVSPDAMERAESIENRVNMLRKRNNKAAAQRMQGGGLWLKSR